MARAAVREAQPEAVVDLTLLVRDIADALVSVDATGSPFKAFQPGVGPYGEPQLVGLIAKHLRDLVRYGRGVKTKRSPDLLIPGQWAVEFKIARPFGDNGREAENWSVNLLHPYAGNVSAIGDCLKLMEYPGPERRASVVIGYEHSPARIPLEPLLASFELLAQQILGIGLSPRVEERREGLRHRFHQQLIVAAWEIVSASAHSRARG
jgi:hypothetical protein